LSKSSLSATAADVPQRSNWRCCC